jgi:hypothetical protein
LASEGADFSKTIKEIGPHILKLAGWLGSEGAQLLKLVGIG